MIVYDSIVPWVVSWFFRVDAITIGSTIFVRRGAASQELIQHELIHVRQGQELFYVGFWVLYVAHWFLNVFKYGSAYQAYRMIPFEIEARAHQHDAYYLLNREPNAWRKFSP